MAAGSRFPAWMAPAFAALVAVLWAAFFVRFLFDPEVPVPREVHVAFVLAEAAVLGLPLLRRGD